MATLYEIKEAILNFDYEIDEETGEILNVDELENLEMEWNEKIENIACWSKNLRSDGKAIIEEGKNQIGRGNKYLKKADSLDAYLASALNGKPFSTTRCEISFRASEAVDVLNDALIPDRYCRYKTSREPDKALIKKALKSGEIIEGAVLKQKKNISVK